MSKQIPSYLMPASKMEVLGYYIKKKIKQYNKTSKTPVSVSYNKPRKISVEPISSVKKPFSFENLPTLKSEIKKGGGVKPKKSVKKIKRKTKDLKKINPRYFKVSNKHENS